MPRLPVYQPMIDPALAPGGRRSIRAVMAPVVAIEKPTPSSATSPATAAGIAVSGMQANATADSTHPPATSHGPRCDRYSSAAGTRVASEAIPYAATIAPIAAASNPRPCRYGGVSSAPPPPPRGGTPGAADSGTGDPWG